MFALKWLLIGVHAEVVDQVPGLREHLVTVFVLAYVQVLVVGPLGLGVRLNLILVPFQCFEINQRVFLDCSRTIFSF